MSLYVVDSNFFIQAHRVNYPLDIAVGFWEQVKKLAHDEKVISIDKVKDELYNNEDELKQWCLSNLPPAFFHTCDQIVSAYTQVINWAVSKNNQYSPAALNEFLDANEADAWLISYALKYNFILVTHEVSAPLSKSKIKIPDVCNHFKVKYVTTMEMFRQLGVKF